MSDLKIAIISTLDKKSSISEINAKIKTIETDSSLAKLNLTVSVNDTQLENVVKQIAVIQEKLKNAKPTSLIPDSDASKFKEVYTSIEQVVAKYKELGSVKVSKDAIDPITNELQKFTLTVTKGTGEVEKLKFELANLKGIQGLPQGSFIPTKQSAVDNTQAIYEKQFQQSQALMLQLQQQDEKQTQQLIADKQKLRQELVALGETGNVTAKQLANVARSVNSVNDVSGLEKAKESFAELADRAKLAEQIAKMREQSAINVMQTEAKANVAQDQAINKNNDLTRKEIQLQQELEAEIKRKLELYQKDKQLQAQTLQSRISPNQQSALANVLSGVTSAKPTDFSSLKELQNFQQQANLGFKEIATNAAAATGNASIFGEAFKSAFSNLSMYIGGTTLLFQSFSALKDGISSLNELNKSLTTISMISHESVDQVAQLGDQFQKLGSQLSVNTNEIAQSAAELYRQNLPLEEINKRLKLITEFSKVAGLSAQDSTNYITAATNSMRISAEKATDTFATLGHSSGVNAGYIAGAFQKVGGSAGALGKMYAQLKFLLIDLEALT